MTGWHTHAIEHTGHQKKIPKTLTQVAAQLVQQRLHFFSFLFRERWLASGLFALVGGRGAIGLLRVHSFLACVCPI